MFLSFFIQLLSSFAEVLREQLGLLEEEVGSKPLDAARREDRQYCILWLNIVEYCCN